MTEKANAGPLNFMKGRLRSCGKKSMPLKTGRSLINTVQVS
jgi:hypothetical protein